MKFFSRTKVILTSLFVLLFIGAPVLFDPIMRGTKVTGGFTSSGVWNGFNNQQVILECVNRSANNIFLSVTVKDTFNSEMGTENFSLAPYGISQVNLNDFPIEEGSGVFDLAGSTRNASDVFCYTTTYATDTNGEVQYVTGAVSALETGKKGKGKKEDNPCPDPNKQLSCGAECCDGSVLECSADGSICCSKREPCPPGEEETNNTVDSITGCLMRNCHPSPCPQSPEIPLNLECSDGFDESICCNGTIETCGMASSGLVCCPIVLPPCPLQTTPDGTERKNGCEVRRCVPCEEPVPCPPGTIEEAGEPNNGCPTIICREIGAG